MKKNKKLILTLTIITVLILILAAFLYIPQFFIKSEDMILKRNTDIIKKYNEWDFSEYDFDNDMLSNEKEKELNTDIWSADTDNDRKSDFLEYNNNENPLKYDNYLKNIIQKNLSENGLDWKSPFKISGYEEFTLWASDEESRYNATICVSRRGYVFNNFTGYVSINGFPYWIENNYHKELKYKKTENVYYIESGMEIEVYEDKQNSRYILNFFNSEMDIEKNFMTDIIDLILPAKGFITSKKYIEDDLIIDTTSFVTAQKKQIIYDENDVLRLISNDNSYEKLKDIRNIIQSGKCVLASFFNEKQGEVVVLVYGYDYYGNLLLADAQSLESLGILEITENSCRTINDDGSISVKEWFSFKGLGIDSEKGDRISFFNKQTG